METERQTGKFRQIEGTERPYVRQTGGHTDRQTGEHRKEGQRDSYEGWKERRKETDRQEDR